MTSSVNGKEGNTTQWNRNDEIPSCGAPDGAPSSKIVSRPHTFCDNVTIEGDLVVAGNVTINGTLTVAGTITAPFFNGTAAKAIVASAIG